MKKFVGFCLLIAGLGIASSATLFARAQETEWKDTNPYDWSGLVETCHTSWSQYEAKVVDLQKKLTAEFTVMSKDEFKDRLFANDPKLLFTEITWPRLLKGKDDSWNSTARCAAYHKKVRQVLDSNNTTAVERQEAVEDLSDCVEQNFTRDESLVPLNEIVSCYETQAKR